MFKLSSQRANCSGQTSTVLRRLYIDSSIPKKQQTNSSWVQRSTVLSSWRCCRCSQVVVVVDAGFNPNRACVWLSCYVCSQLSARKYSNPPSVCCRSSRKTIIVQFVLIKTRLCCCWLKGAFGDVDFKSADVGDFSKKILYIMWSERWNLKYRNNIIKEAFVVEGKEDRGKKV